MRNNDRHFHFLFRLGAIALCLGLLLMSLQAAAEGETSVKAVGKLKVLSLNFNAEANNSEMKKRRFERFKKYIVDQDLDVIFIQETWQIENDPNLGVRAARELGLDVAYHFEDGVVGVRVTSTTILAKKYLNLRGIRAFKLPHSVPTVGNGTDTWVSLGETNILIGGTVTLNGGQVADVWTAHYMVANPQYRYDQARFSLEQMQQLVRDRGETWEKAWVFFGGDLNAEPSTPEMKMFREEAQFSDLWLKVHQDDPGHTITNDVTDPEYNPMEHAANQLPSQLVMDTPSRIDYLYAHIPADYAVGVTRVMTSPLDGMWMSDHYGVLGTFDFDGEGVIALPSADSDMAALGQPTYIEITDENWRSLPSRLKLSAPSPRGFAVVNRADLKVEVVFTSNIGNIYNAGQAMLEPDNIVSFVFFGPGKHNFRLRLILPGPWIDPGGAAYEEIHGTLTVP